jgi:hypothetical protein
MIKYFYDKNWKKSKGGYTTHSPNRERVKSKFMCIKGLNDVVIKLQKR